MKVLKKDLEQELNRTKLILDYAREEIKTLKNEEATVSEEQVLFNKLNWEEQQFILKQMRMLQPCELNCEVEEDKKIPEKLNEDFNQHCNEYLYKKVEDKVNEIIDYLDYLKIKGE